MRARGYGTEAVLRYRGVPFRPTCRCTLPIGTFMTGCHLSRLCGLHVRKACNPWRGHRDNQRQVPGDLAHRAARTRPTPQNGSIREPVAVRMISTRPPQKERESPETPHHPRHPPHPGNTLPVPINPWRTNAVSAHFRAPRNARWSAIRHPWGRRHASGSWRCLSRRPAPVRLHR